MSRFNKPFEATKELSEQLRVQRPKSLLLSQNRMRLWVEVDVGAGNVSYVAEFIPTNNTASFNNIRNALKYMEKYQHKGW